MRLPVRPLIKPADEAQPAGPPSFALEIEPVAVDTVEMPNATAAAQLLAEAAQTGCGAIPDSICPTSAAPCGGLPRCGAGAGRLGAARQSRTLQRQAHPERRAARCNPGTPNLFGSPGRGAASARHGLLRLSRARRQAGCGGDRIVAVVLRAAAGRVACRRDRA